MRRRITFSRSVTLSLSQPQSREEVLALLDGARRRRVKELLVRGADRARLEDAVWACERALERGLLPRTELGALPRDELARLREVAASQGVVLAAAGVAGEETIRAAGELRIPMTVGIEATAEDGVLESLAAVHADHGQIQAVVLPSDAQADLQRLVAYARRILPDVSIQVAVAEWSPELVRAGATDLGDLGGESPSAVRKRLAAGGYALTERLCVHSRYVDADWVAQGVLDVIKRDYWSFIPRRGSGRRTERPIARDGVPAAIARARDGQSLTEEELTALFAETRPEAIEDLRQAADELRAEVAGDTVTFVVNRNINVSNVCIVGCAFCGFGQGRRSPDAYEHDRDEFAQRVLEAIEFGATEVCMQSGIHPAWSFEDYLGWLRLAKETAAGAGAELHMHAYSPMEIAHMQDVSRVALPEVFARLRDAGLDSTPGTAAEVLHDGVRERISPNKLPVARWVEIIEASHRAGLRSTSTVMFGHIEEPWELAEHMRVIRALQERTHGITEFVPLSFIPFHTLLGRTHGIEEISREENLKHTAVFRLALGRAVPNVQASWVKMGLDAAVEALRWGVNDLGGTLMEESISRMAGSYHGVRLEPADLVAAAHRAGRPAAERTTLYELRRDFPVIAAAT